MSGNGCGKEGVLRGRGLGGMVIEIVMDINEFREGEIKEGRSWEELYEKELIGMGRFVYGLFRCKGIDAMP